MASSVQDECVIDHTPTSAVAAGDVVMLADLFCVAPCAIAANALGAVAVEGVWSCPKAGSLAISQGAIVYWNHVAGNITTAADSGGGSPVSYKRAGKAAKAALAADTTVQVLINCG